MASLSLSTGRSWFGYSEYDEGRDSPVLLVLAALVAAFTFRAGFNPPPVVVRQDKEGVQAPVKAIYGSHGFYYVFLISNTVALSWSVLVIVSVTYKLPFCFEILAGMGCMIATYATSVFAITSRESVKFRYIVMAAAAHILIRCFIQMVKLCYFTMMYSRNDE